MKHILCFKISETLMVGMIIQVFINNVNVIYQYNMATWVCFHKVGLVVIGLYKALIDNNNVFYTRLSDIPRCIDTLSVGVVSL